MSPFYTGSRGRGRAAAAVRRRQRRRARLAEKKSTFLRNLTIAKKLYFNIGFLQLLVGF